MIDPRSGNMVPPGAMPEEVRDDVPINASEGEYVLPADVVRYLGLDKIEKLVRQAKKGIEEMGQEGRIGGEPPAPEMPPEMPQEPMGFNQGGLVTGVAPQTTPANPDFNTRDIGFAFSPAPYTGGFNPSAGTIIKKYIGPDGRILYIPVNAAGNPVIPVPEGFVDAQEEPTTPEEVQQQSAEVDTYEGGRGMWSDGLTPEEIRQEQEAKTFRTYDELHPTGRAQGTGELPGFIGDALGGIGDRIKSAFEKFTSGEALGAISTLAGTVLLGPLAGPIAGKLMGQAIDSYNEKRRAEGLPEQAVEDVLAEAAPSVNISASQVQEIANNSELSPSRYRTVNRENLNYPATPNNVQREATQAAGIDPEKYTVLGVTGTEENPSFMIRGPDGKIHSGIKPGDDIDGVRFEGLKPDVDPFNITGQPLSQVANLGGTLNERPSMMDPFQQSQEALGRNQIGFQSGLQNPLADPRARSIAPTSLVGRQSTSSGGSSMQQGRGLSPTSQGVGFGDLGGGGGSSDESAQYSGPAGGRTSSGGSVTGSAAAAGYSQGQSTVGRAGVGSSFTDQHGSVGTGGGSGLGYSMGQSVSNFSSFDQNNPRGFNKGGLVDSPYKSYDITRGYKKGGLVKRNKDYPQ